MTQLDRSDLRDGVLVSAPRAPFNQTGGVRNGTPGSIHDDATATKLGFRGGTIAGSIHMDQFPPVLLDAFGPSWFETGTLSLYFQNATISGETVRAFVRAPDGLPAADTQVDVWVDREDGLRVAEGTASAGKAGAPTALEARDLRPDDPANLRMLAAFPLGTTLGEHDLVARSEDQSARAAGGRLCEPVDWYTSASPWGGPIAAPSTAVNLLYSRPSATFRGGTAGGVGLFGAIQLRHVGGPILLDRTYRVTGSVLAVGQSPKTEYVWFETAADDEAGVRVAEMRMLLRWMKASSAAYAE